MDFQFQIFLKWMAGWRRLKKSSWLASFSLDPPCKSSVWYRHFVRQGTGQGETRNWEVSAKTCLLPHSLGNHSLLCCQDLCPISPNSFCLLFLYMVVLPRMSFTVHRIWPRHLSPNRKAIISLFIFPYYSFVLCKSLLESSCEGRIHYISLLLIFCIGRRVARD